MKTFNIKELREWEDWFKEELENLTDNMGRMYGISIENNLKNEIVRMCFEMMDGRIRVKGDDYEI